jgi:Concanavalin A-like lectin/glucanases superfamily
MRSRELVLGVLALVLIGACGGGKPGGKKTGGTVGTEGETGGTGGDSLPPDAGPPPLRPRGGSCTSSNQCQTGSCVDGFCCDTACTGACTTCKLPGSEGRCVPVPEGMDIDNECPDDGVGTCRRDGMCDGNGACRKYPAGTECMPGMCSGTTESAARMCDGNGTCLPGTSQACPTNCSGGACNRTCSDANPCQAGFFCDATGMCKLKVPLGMSCTASAECSTGVCADGVCCRSECNQLCYSCNLPGLAGTCTPVPGGQDPKGECPAQTPNTCGNAGACNGAGACRVHPAGTPCGAQTCTGSTETSARTCNGAGACLEGTVTNCSPFRCGGTMCRQTCTNTNQCDLGFTCMGGQCTGDGQAGLVLHWRFDEPAGGTVAVDTSGAMHAGTYIGTMGTPTMSTLVASIGGANPASRAFVRGSRHAVQLAGTPADLKPASELTVSAWYRATSVDTSGATLVSAGNNYLIRLRPTQIEFAKRTTTAAGTTTTGQALATVAGMLNGSWHHVAGVTSATEGMKLYVDGALVRSEPTQTRNILYDQGQDLFVGRDGNGSANWDFDGNIDDVRIYDMALSQDDIATLVHGNRPEVLLHWRFDEASGTAAIDDSGNDLNGTYTGTTGIPAPSTLVPNVSFDDPRSRRFTRANRHAARFANMPTVLQPANDITVSAWYRATGPLDTAGAELVSAGNSYLLRLLPTRIEFSKRYTNAAGAGATALLDSPDLAGSSHLDGKWHHVAAVTTPSGMRLYFDGVEVNASNRGEDIRYDQGRDFWVGRHGNNLATYDFEGNIDEVFVHGRALSGPEIADLAKQQGPATPELALVWAFDDTTGATAQDTSPGGTSPGTYVNGPVSSTDVPAVSFADPRSRLFDRAQRQAVSLTPMPAGLQPVNDLTVSVWYKARTALGGGMTGEELVSAGDNYLVRLRATQVEFSKRTAAGIQTCLAPVGAAKIFDGGWHHIGATTSTDQIRVYFDGVQQTCPNGTNGDIVYTAGQSFWVGRHGNNQNTWDFDGNIDEVRIYRRALSPDEIVVLATQTPKPAPMLQWKFDETTGTTAADATANHFDGTYIGTPVSDANVPPGVQNDPASLKLDGSMRQAVTRAPVPPMLKPNNNVTVSAWYRATAVDAMGTPTGAELVSAGNSYLLRLRATGVEFSKQTAAGNKQCIVDAPAHLNGQWHHVVGVSSATDGLIVYFDGAPICNHPADIQDIIYTGQGTDLFVGRHGNGEEQWDFTGNVDDVRIYGSALTADQVLAIFHNTF